MDQTPKWTQAYGADPTMTWSRYAVVNPVKFDIDAFGGKSSAAAPAKQ
jgi:hypothetical protein